MIDKFILLNRATDIYDSFRKRDITDYNMVQEVEDQEANFTMNHS